MRSSFSFQSCANRCPPYGRAVGAARVAVAVTLLPFAFTVACGGGVQPANVAARPAAATAPNRAPESQGNTASGRGPAPASVTAEEPGGDAADRHAAALERLVSAPWGARTDKADQIRMPLPDWENWKRVRYFGVEHFVGFRYGDDHHAMALAFVQDLPPGTPATSDSCLRRFEAWGLPQTHPFDVKFTPFESHFARWQGHTLETRTVDGRVNLGFSSPEFSGAWAAYPAYPSACLVMAIAVPWRDHKELAQKLRDRWVSEGFPLLNVASAVRPEPQ